MKKIYLFVLLVSQFGTFSLECCLVKGPSKECKSNCKDCVVCANSIYYGLFSTFCGHATCAACSKGGLYLLATPATGFFSLASGTFSLALACFPVYKRLRSRGFSIDYIEKNVIFHKPPRGKSVALVPPGSNNV